MPLVLLEDFDGIQPSGSITCDRTPTVSWDGAVGGGPFLYLWELHPATGAMVASGAVIDTNQATLPAVDLGSYRLSIRAIGASGGTVQLASGSFQVVSTLLFRKGELQPVSEEELELVEEPDPEYIRYFPQWLSLHGTATAPPSGALLFRMLMPFLGDLGLIQRRTMDQQAAAALLTMPARLPRLGWHLPTRFFPQESVTISVSASGLTRPVRRATSTYDFLTADDMVFALGERQLLFRNLAERLVRVSPQAVSGSPLASQYRMPAEAEGIVADTDVLFEHGGREYRIRAGSRGVDYDRAIVQLPDSFTGEITFRYQSRTLKPLVTVSVSGGSFLAPFRVDLWNRFDEWGLLAGLRRRPDEENTAFRERIYSRLLTSPGTDAASTAQQFAQEIQLTEVIGWNGRTTLNLAASGIFGVRRVDIPGVPEIGVTVEELVRDGFQRYSASKTEWLPGSLIVVDGIPALSSRFPNLFVSGNVVHFGQGVSGTVYATFRYRNYRLSTSSQGFVTAVTPVSGNLASGEYRVILTKNVRVFTAADDAFKEAHLLNADGTSNTFFHELREQLMAGSNLHVGRARWGKDAHWLDETDTEVPVERLPAVFDTHL